MILKLKKTFIRSEQQTVEIFVELSDWFKEFRAKIDVIIWIDSGILEKHSSSNVPLLEVNSFIKRFLESPPPSLPESELKVIFESLKTTLLESGFEIK